MIGRTDVEAAWRLIQPHVRRTPTIELSAGALGVAAPLALKLESLQLSGSFKGRGAFHKLLASKVPAYEDPVVFAGAGSVALEFAEQAAFDTLLVAVGGGGLIAGCAAAIGESVKIVAVETEGTPTLYEARRAGRPVDVKISGIAADALGASRIGVPNFEVAQKLVRESVLVNDDAVREAQRALWEELRLIAEPAGATGLAALMAGVYRPAPGERVATLICGANTTPSV